MDDREQTIEERSIYRNRYDEARKAGLSIAEAQLFAESDGDISLLRKLVKGGCPPEKIARIVI